MCKSTHANLTLCAYVRKYIVSRRRISTRVFRITPEKKLLILSEVQKMLQKLLDNPRIIYFVTQF